MIFKAIFIIIIILINALSLSLFPPTPPLYCSPSPSLPLPLVERQDLVELFIESVTLRQSVQDASLKILPDLFRLSKKLQQGKGTLQV